MKFEVKLIKTSIISGELELDNIRELESLVNKNNLAQCIKDSPIQILLNQGTLEETETFFESMQCSKLSK